VKVGDLVRLKEEWSHACEEFKAKRHKVAIVTQDWDTHDNFAVVWMGETVEAGFNDVAPWNDAIMEKVP